MAVRLSYHDAMTFDGETGGAKMGMQFRPIYRRENNKEFLHTVEEMKHFKENETIHTMDKLSLSDFTHLGAAFAIYAATGPGFSNELTYGRVDCASAEEAATFGSAPCPTEGVSAYKDGFLARGFTDEETVALSYIHAFGKVQHPNQTLRSTHSYFDNYFYQALLKGENTGVIGEVLKDSSFAESVEEFAQDKHAFYSVFGQAFLKMINLGQDESSLKRMEEGFLNDDYWLRENMKTTEEVFAEHWYRN